MPTEPSLNIYIPFFYGDVNRKVQNLIFNRNRQECDDNSDIKQQVCLPEASLQQTLIRSSWRSLSPWQMPLGSIPCSSLITSQNCNKITKFKIIFYNQTIKYIKNNIIAVYSDLLHIFALKIFLQLFLSYHNNMIKIILTNFFIEIFNTDKKQENNGFILFS